MRLFAVILLFFAVFAFSQNNTGIPAIDTLKRYDWDIDTKRNSLAATLGLALIFPGGGQFYTEHYVRGGFLFTFETALIYETFFNKFRQNREFNKNIRVYSDSASHYKSLASFYSSFASLYQGLLDSHIDSPDTAVWLIQIEKFKEQAEIEKDNEKIHAKVLLKERSKKKASVDLWKSELAWLAGLHVYGLFDAYGIWKNNQGHSPETHSAVSALWRAALIPGWGQIYNHEYGKAGMLYMGLFGSAVSYYSRQEMVEYHLENLRQARAEEDLTAISAINEDVLFFRKKRNQYIWAITLFYIYSLADAAVDAMLHDFDSPAYFVMQPTLNRGFSAEAGFYF